MEQKTILRETAARQQDTEWTAESVAIVREPSASDVRVDSL